MFVVIVDEHVAANATGHNEAQLGHIKYIATEIFYFS
jgi:hypothetical protein